MLKKILLSIMLLNICAISFSSAPAQGKKDDSQQFSSSSQSSSLGYNSQSSSSSSSTLPHACNSAASTHSNAIAILKNNNIDISSATTAILFNHLPSELQNHLWDYLRPWKHKQTLVGHTESVLCVAHSPDGSQLATGSYDHSTKIWNSATGQCLLTIGRYAILNSNGSQTVINPDGHKNMVLCLAYTPNGRQLATGSWDSSIKIWNPATGQCLLTIGGYAILNPDGSQTIINPDGHKDIVLCLAYNSDGRQLATGSWDRSIKIWSPATGQCLRTIGGYENQRNSDGTQTVINPDGHKDKVHCIAYTPDGSQLATGSSDRSTKLWNPATGQCLLTIGSYAILNPDGTQTVINPDGHKNIVLCLAYNSDGRQLATGSWDRSIKIWSPATGQCLLTIGGHAIKYYHDGTQTVINPDGHKDTVYCLAYSPNGSQLATGSSDRSTKLWNPATGQCLLTIGGYEIQHNLDGSQTVINPDGHKDIVSCIAYSPDGRQLATGSGDKTVKIWKRLASKQELQYIEVRAKKEYKNVLNSVLLRAKSKK